MTAAFYSESLSGHSARWFYYKNELHMIIMVLLRLFCTEDSSF